MSDLRALQTWFVAAMTRGDDPQQGSSMASRELTLPPLEQLLTGYRARTALDRFAVYHHAYRARLVECLQDDYPVLEHALGQLQFANLCHGYLAAHPSRSFSLNRFGAGLPAYASQHAPQPAGFFADLSRLEWALVEAVHAEAGPGLSLERVGALAPEDWERARLIPSASLSLHRFHYPVNEYFRAIKERGEAPLPAPRATATAVCRKDLQIWRVDLAPAAASALDALMRGETLLHALTSANAEPADVSAWFRTWMECGFFDDVRLI